MVDLNSENVLRATEAGEPAFYGDVTSSEVLQSVGAERARDLVVAINDPTAAINAVRAARTISEDLHIVVRSRYLADVEALKRAGADKVIPAELEAALELASYLMTRTCAYDPAQIDVLLDQMRREHGADLES
ncbi:MAG: NAD-binding protein [Candidatus Alcyoniella australis]|nr:NAD-binding protein [Candidatus Alcyoniella australis]